MIREAIYKSIRNDANYSAEEMKKDVVKQFQDQYLLKVAGSDQYFLADCPISQYKWAWSSFQTTLFMVPPLRYIRQCIAKADTPHLTLMPKERVYSSLPNNDFHMPGMRNEPLLKVFSLERHLFFSLLEGGGRQS